MKQIGAAIRAARKQQGIRLHELGEELGMGASTLSKIENGVVEEIGIRKVMRIMERLGLELKPHDASTGYTIEDANEDIHHNSFRP